jgi:hypothetical protein
MLNPRLRPPALSLLLAVSSLTSSCFFRKTPQGFTPPPPRAQPQLSAKQPVIATPPPLIAGDPAATVPMAPATIPDLPPPPAPRPTPRRPQPAPPPKPVTTTPPTEPQPPRLGQMFTPDEMRNYNRAIDDSLNRVRRALDLLSRKNLNPDQQVEVSRIATFQKQAEQARDAQDLLTAKNLAERADTLAQDLLSRVP